MLMTQSITGKLILKYVGHQGRHTELYIDNTLVAAGYNCNKSIMLLLWCACNSRYKDIQEILNSEFEYEETELGKWICRVITRKQILSKYDVLMTSNAAAYAYRDMIYKKKYHDPINIVLSAKQDLINHFKHKFKLTDIEVIYELDENEIWQSGGVQPGSFRD